MAGDSPSVGSSSRSSLGPSASARAIETILRSPPERACPPRSGIARASGNPIGVVDARLGAAGSGQVQVGIAMFSATVNSPKISLSSGAKPTPMRAIR